ncbi:hypothetical protein M9458_039804, partial [Cirrhinus mrigala]
MKRMRFCSDEEQKVPPVVRCRPFVSRSQAEPDSGVSFLCWSRKRQRVCEKMNGRLH